MFVQIRGNSMDSFSNCHFAIVGATGVVGLEFLKILEDERIPAENVTLIASKESVCKNVPYLDTQLPIHSIDPIPQNIDMAFFSAGEKIAQDYVPKFARKGMFVIDNSACFRRDPQIPLIIPEINKECLVRCRGLRMIANPNCVTIELLMALAPVYKKWGLSKVVVTTLQSVSGAGKEALKELHTVHYQSNLFPQPIRNNVIPQIGDILLEGGTQEEDKISFEVNKILRPEIKFPVAATCVRIPIEQGHCESVYFETNEETSLHELENFFHTVEGVTIAPLCSLKYSTPKEVVGKDNVYISRLRQIDSKAYQMWLAFDNIRKGAALNGWQIAKELIRQGLILK